MFPPRRFGPNTSKQNQIKGSRLKCLADFQWVRSDLAQIDHIIIIDIIYDVKQVAGVSGLGLNVDGLTAELIKLSVAKLYGPDPEPESGHY